MRENRIHPRVPVHLEVLYRSERELASSYIESLSQGGVFIRTSRPLPVGTELTMEISLEDQKVEPIFVRGKVVWDRLVGRENGMGVQFTEPPPDSLRKLLTPERA